MPTFVFEAMNAQGQEIQDEIEAATQDEAQATIRRMGYFITDIREKRAPKAAAGKSSGKKAFALGGAGGKKLTMFTRQLSILQDAGLPILRSLRILEEQSKPGALKNALMDVCEDIESGASLSEAMGKHPRCFSRLYVNMVKAGEAGGSLETILRRLAEFLEAALSIRNRIIGAMIYPVVVVLVAIGILTFIMIAIVPVFKKMFEDFELDLPDATQLLIDLSDKLSTFWWAFLLIPLSAIVFVVIVNQFRAGRMGWHLYLLSVPVIGGLIEKSVLARTTRTLGTLVSSGVPILEALSITRETSSNAAFEKIYTRVIDAIREGDTIARPLKNYSRPGFHPVALLFWIMTVGIPPLLLIPISPTIAITCVYISIAGAVLAGLTYMLRMNRQIIDLLVVNMVDVGEESGELDTMLYKVADYYDEEVKTAVDGMLKLIEPMMIVFLGGAVGFIVISLFMPLVGLISGLSGGKK